MSNYPQPPSGEEPDDRRGRDISSEAERDRRGRQRGSRGAQGDSGQGNVRGSQRSSYEQHPSQGRGYPQETRGSHPVGRETRAEPHRSHLGRLVALGVIGLLLLGGLIGGLVAAFTGGSTYKPTSAALHPPTHVSAPATSHLLQQFQNTGPKNSDNFKVSSSPVTSHYTYSCPSGPNTFRAQMFNTSGTDEQTITNTSGTGGSGSAVLHPAPGGVYHVWAYTSCHYSVQIYGS
jgi:hypothetical protein